MQHRELSGQHGEVLGRKEPFIPKEGPFRLTKGPLRQTKRFPGQHNDLAGQQMTLLTLACTSYFAILYHPIYKEETRIPDMRHTGAHTSMHTVECGIYRWKIMSWIQVFYRLTLAQMGVEDPSGFSRSAKKRPCIAPPFFACLIRITFRKFPENFVPGHFRSGQVALPQNVCHITVARVFEG